MRRDPRLYIRNHPCDPLHPCSRNRRTGRSTLLPVQSVTIFSTSQPYLAYPLCVSPRVELIKTPMGTPDGTSLLLVGQVLAFPGKSRMRYRNNPFRKMGRSFFSPDHPSRFLRIHFEIRRRRFTRRVYQFSIPEQSLRDRDRPSRDMDIAFFFRREARIPYARISPPRGTVSRRGPFISRMAPSHSRRWNIHYTFRSVHFSTLRIPVVHQETSFVYEDVIIRAWYKRSVPGTFRFSSFGHMYFGLHNPLLAGKKGIWYSEMRSHEPETPIYDPEMSLHDPEMPLHGLGTPSPGPGSRLHGLRACTQCHKRESVN